MLTSINRDFVWQAIHNALPAKRRVAQTQFVNINCPMCLSRHQPRPDTKMRCGVIKKPDGVAVHCFNCGFKAKYVFGQKMSRVMREFMQNLGIDELSVAHLAHTARQIHTVFGAAPALPQPSPFAIEFPPAELPPQAKSFAEWAEVNCTDPDFLAVAEYLFSRGDAVARATTYYWTPYRKHHLHRRVIVPFYWQERIVGWTARVVEGANVVARLPATPYVQRGNLRKFLVEKYHNGVSPPNFLFNNRFITTRDRLFIILVEGIFDALAIEGVGVAGAELNDAQADWLKNSGKTIIVVPDRDASGQRLIDAALKHGWQVSFPRQSSVLGLWDRDVKDTAEAVRRYGRLYVLRSILASAVGKPNQIQILRKLLLKG